MHVSMAASFPQFTAVDPGLSPCILTLHAPSIPKHIRNTQIPCQTDLELNFLLLVKSIWKDLQKTGFVIEEQDKQELYSFFPIPNILKHIYCYNKSKAFSAAVQNSLTSILRNLISVHPVVIKTSRLDKTYLSTYSKIHWFSLENSSEHTFIPHGEETFLHKLWYSLQGQQ